MRNMIRCFSAAGLSLCVLGCGGQKGFACSTFFLHNHGQMVFGKNLDWHTPDGLVIINKRGVTKRALLTPPVIPKEWTSQYGSITFNQVGREFPFGGMNEKGLVVEQMWLDDTIYPGTDERPVLGELQWIQYHLDTAASVKELITNSKAVRIGQCEANLHFLVADREGHAAIIEFLKGKMVIHTGKDLPVAALTNTPYNQLLKKTQSGATKKNDSFFVFLNGSEDRFVRLADMIRAFEKKAAPQAVDYGLRMLKRVSQGSLTVWSIVYDLKNLAIYFKTRDSKGVKSLKLKGFDFDCINPVKVLDVNLKAKGDVTEKFSDYNREIHRNLVTEVFRQFDRQGFKSATPQAHIDNLVNYPDSCKCKNPKHR